ncbi:VCBS repeat-containing protein [Myxococcota bacterium]|nr:VCBS repeat-containing protein [Myxococcota bacterium]
MVLSLVLILGLACEGAGENPTKDDPVETGEPSGDSGDDSGRDSGESHSGDSGDDSDTDLAPQRCTGFAPSPTPLGLPEVGALGAAFTGLRGDANCASLDPAYTLMNLLGDGRPELVVTRDCRDASVGRDTWSVHLGSASGFGAAPTPYTLPSVSSSSPGLPFPTDEEAEDCDGSGLPGYALTELHGDGRAELVLTVDCADEATGASQWLVYAAESAGFAAAATPFTLPSAPVGDDPPWGRVEAGADCGDGVPGHALLDLSGDGAPDLVVTRACDDETVGQRRWDVYLGGSGGVSATATPWALPELGEGTTFTGLEGTAACRSGRGPSYALAHADGDGVLDLIVTEDCADAAVGTTIWRVYAGSATGGFAATGIDWALPEYAVGQPIFLAISAPAACSQGDLPAYDADDIDHDGWLDLIVSDDCQEPEVGVTRWAVHRGGPEGFAKEATAWPLPPGYSVTDAPFAGRSGTANCASRDLPTWALADLTHDGALDLVVMYDCEDDEVGRLRWDVYAAVCEG